MVVTGTCEIRVVTTGCTTAEEPTVEAVKVGKWVGLTVKITSFEVTRLPEFFDDEWLVAAATVLV